ncbi:DUF4411 family protein [Chryseobacterium nematophagum]|uniref:DUF4411 family protein n=1 Tax=Chryseobacterium nematophagum TaxID=2305228 RepID=A0A3M7LEB8_9FLAO|nr:DUF4411 family protein [Chryseobacterium nematophagum]RMZ60404.1 DUF4411 family protein [Chryseobacterium nematophagum]
MKKYLLDSNILIQAHRMHYPFDVFPSFWSKLINLSENNFILSIDKVKKEICEISNPDNLSNWCMNDIRDTFFVDTSSCVDAYSQIAIWANVNTQYTQNAKDEFLQTDLADPWLIAYALKNNCKIVTYENSDPYAKRKIKIPEPCNHFGVEFTTPIQMMRELGDTF